MSGREMSIEPKEVPEVCTGHRSIVSKIPHPDDVKTLNCLREKEPLSMRGQAQVLWTMAKDCYVGDNHKNQWLDWSSGVLISNVGHNHPRIINAIRAYLDSCAPLATYCFPNEHRAKLASKLVEISPFPEGKAFLLSTGSEATEVSMKLARTNYGLRQSDGKGFILSHENAFHGRTLAAQLAGGALGGGGWVKGIDSLGYFVKVPYPKEHRGKERGFQSFLNALYSREIDENRIAGVIVETFPGRNATLMPKQYAQDLREWCDEKKVVLIMDEVQAGFGRTGKLWGFEHYDIVPDLICCGKGISSSLPLSAVIGKRELMDLYGMHEMTSTHGGSPLPVVAALASLETLLENDSAIIRNAEKVGKYLGNQLEAITRPYLDRVSVNGIGLVHAMQFYTPDGNPNAERANRLWEEAIYGGNMFFAPVGVGGATIKFCPPLTITPEAIDDGIYGPEGIKQKLDMVMKE